MVGVGEKEGEGWNRSAVIHTGVGKPRGVFPPPHPPPPPHPNTHAKQFNKYIYIYIYAIFIMSYWSSQGLSLQLLLFSFLSSFLGDFFPPPPPPLFCDTFSDTQNMGNLQKMENLKICERVMLDIFQAYFIENVKNFFKINLLSLDSHIESRL